MSFSNKPLSKKCRPQRAGLREWGGAVVFEQAPLTPDPLSPSTGQGEGTLKGYVLQPLLGLISFDIKFHSQSAPLDNSLFKKTLPVIKVPDLRTMHLGPSERVALPLFPQLRLEEVTACRHFDKCRCYFDSCRHGAPPPFLKRNALHRSGCVPALA